MNSVFWVNPDTLRISDGEMTGLLRFEGENIEVNVEIFGTDIPNTIQAYVIRATQLLDTFRLVNPHLVEPEPEPDYRANLPEPDYEAGIWTDFILPDYLYDHSDEPLIQVPEFQ